jgi:signal transduction histidine kinase
VSPPAARILVVDDRHDQLVTLRAVLSDVVDEIVCASSARDALRLLLDSGEFALMLLDVQMPEMDGLDLAELIRKHRVHRQTPIIFVTASGDELHMRRSYALGAVDYILSPIVPAILRTKVGVFVDVYKKTAQLRMQTDVLSRRATQLRSLTDASIRIHASASVPEILRAAAEGARAIVAAEYVVATAALAGEQAPPHAAHVGDAIEPDEVDDKVQSPGETLVRSLTWSDGSPLGALQVRRKRGAAKFDPDDEAVIAQLSHLTSVALQNRVLGDAREANRLKDEFFTNLSHELRNPLTAVVGWIQLLQKMPAADDALRARALEALGRNTALLTRLVDDLLDVSRIAGHGLNIVTKPMRLEEAVRTTVESLRVTGEAKGIFVELRVDEGPIEVLGDSQRLTQAVWNLVSNALKFSTTGGHVTVSVAAQSPNGVLVVEDDGEGIAPEFLPHVFERFRQARDGTRHGHGNGLGLGLSIVRSVVELHGGTVQAESRGLGLGARFTVRLPLIASRERAVRASSPPSAMPPSHIAPAAVSAAEGPDDTVKSRAAGAIMVGVRH